MSIKPTQSFLSTKNFCESELASLGYNPNGSKMIELGGSLRKGKRKVQRPFDAKKAHHLVLRSQIARKELSMTHKNNKYFVENTLSRLSKKYFIKIHSFANVGNHLHIVVETKTKSQRFARTQFSNFLRELTGKIARKILYTQKANQTTISNIKTMRTKFWDTLAYTKVIEWGKHFETLSNYIIFNQLEGINKLRRFGKNPSDGWILICDPPTS